MMRRFLLIMVAVAALVSCKKSEIPSIPDTSKLRISVVSNKLSQGVVGTRATSIDGFNSVSQMGIYATISPSTDLSGARNINIAYGNSNGSQYWDAVNTDQSIMHAGVGESLNLFGYHPHTGQLGSTVALDPLLPSPTLVYTLPLDQSVDSTLVCADLMWGSTNDVKQEAGSAKMEFIHKLTKVTFNIFKGIDWGSEQAYISELRMSGAPLYVSTRMELSSGTLAVVDNIAGLAPTLVSTFTDPLSLSSFEPRECDFIAIPVSDAAGLLVEFVVNGVMYKFFINAATVPNVSNRSFNSGHNRVYNVTVNKFSPEQVYVTTTMVPWNVVSEIGMEGL